MAYVKLPEGSFQKQCGSWWCLAYLQSRKGRNVLYEGPRQLAFKLSEVRVDRGRVRWWVSDQRLNLVMFFLTGKLRVGKIFDFNSLVAAHVHVVSTLIFTRYWPRKVFRREQERKHPLFDCSFPGYCFWCKRDGSTNPFVGGRCQNWLADFQQNRCRQKTQKSDMTYKYEGFLEWWYPQMDVL